MASQGASGLVIDRGTSARDGSARPTIHPTALVHPFANVVGQVTISAGAKVGPGTSLRADRGAAFHIGAGASVEDGALIHGLAAGCVLGDDGQDYAVWIGEAATVSHLALVHGPAYIGNGCFIGFRSTVFNARVGDGCIVMMHVLIQDVEIPSGRYVPSGSTILTQEQADALPVARERDREFVRQLAGLDHWPEGVMTPAIDDQPANGSAVQGYRSEGSGGSVVTTTLSAELVQQVRQLLAQGYQVSAEYADTRRFRANAWTSCALPRSAYESDVLTALEGCLRDHAGEYIRLIGIDPAVKKRVYEGVVHRPGDRVGGSSTPVAKGGAPSSNGSKAPAASVAASGDLSTQVRQLLSQGYQIGTEHADARRFRANAWTTCKPIDSTSESQVLTLLQGCLRDHAGEYVRLIGIDKRAKKRVFEVVIQRPDGSSAAAATNGTARATSNGAGSGVTGLSGDLASQIRQLVGRGCKITAEYADARRFRANAWTTCASVQATSEREAIAALNACMADHAGAYVRLVAVDPSSKRRAAEIIVQRPGGAVQAANNAVSFSAPATSSNNGAAPVSGGNVPATVAQQIQKLLGQGYRIGAEYADARRFRANAWTSCGGLEGTSASQVLAALNACLANNPTNYVRVIGIDPAAKKRVYEEVVQRPGR